MQFADVFTDVASITKCRAGRYAERKESLRTRTARAVLPATIFRHLSPSRPRARRVRPPGLSRGLSTVWHITRDARSGLRGRTGRTGGATLGAGPRGPGHAAYRACDSSGSTRCHAAANTRRVLVERQKLRSLINPRLAIVRTCAIATPIAVQLLIVDNDMMPRARPSCTARPGLPP